MSSVWPPDNERKEIDKQRMDKIWKRRILHKQVEREDQRPPFSTPAEYGYNDFKQHTNTNSSGE